MRGLFVSATSTGVGKTWVTRGLGACASRAGLKVAALKPIETGVEHTPEDALAIGRACGRPELAHLPGLVRRRLPASPLAAERDGEPAIDLPALITTIENGCVQSDLALIEGAGGLFVPLDAQHTIADLAGQLGWPVLLVAPDRLGVLSDVLAYLAASEAVGLEILGVVLVAPNDPDTTVRHNRAILLERCAIPIWSFPHVVDDDAALAAAITTSGLDEVLGLGRPTSRS